jgi:hypothetical protein
MALKRVVLTTPLSGGGGWASGRTHPGFSSSVKTEIGSCQNRSVPGEGTPTATCETSHSQECWSPILQAWGCLSWNQRAPDEGAPTATCETLHSLEFWLPIPLAWGCLPWNQSTSDEEVSTMTGEAPWFREYHLPASQACAILVGRTGGRPERQARHRNPGWVVYLPQWPEFLCLETKGPPTRRHPLSYCLGVVGGRRPGAWDSHTFMPQAMER